MKEEFTKKAADEKKRIEEIGQRLGKADPEVVKMLLDAGADPIEKFGERLGKADPEIVKMLLDRGADPNIKDPVKKVRPKDKGPSLK